MQTRRIFDSLPARKAAQRAIFSVQRELERLVIEERKSAVVLCDRGTPDGLAYWPNSEEAFWRETGTTRTKEFEKYAAVIHLRTPGSLAPGRGIPIGISWRARRTLLQRRRGRL